MGLYKVFILLGIFIVIVYVYTYIKMKKNKEKIKKIDTIRDFNKSYNHLRDKNAATSFNNKNQDSQYTKYITKYNSSEDYREKN
ncbi:MAG: hypothetical protein NC489_36955 [Ruminococcus flavefaciens]|nr:hypothetical protein [Ruminococcus flavefaciens]